MIRAAIQRVVVPAALGLLVALVSARADEPAEAEAPGLQALITTVEDEQIAGPIARLEDGVLHLATEPERSLPLDDVARIVLGDSAAVAAGADNSLVWVGQDNHDLVQVGSASGGNGIQDIHLHATALRPHKIKQIRVISRFPDRWAAWRLDTSNSPHWRLAIARVDVEPEADLYIEPRVTDSFGHEFEVTYTYEDGKETTSKVVASTHTSDKQRIDRGRRPGTVTPAGAEAAASVGPVAQVLLADGRLRGTLKAMSGESLQLAIDGGEPIEIPLLHVRGVWFGNSASAAALAQFHEKLAAPVGEDVVFVLAPDDTVSQVQVGVRGLSDERLQVSFRGNDREIERKRALGVVFAAHPPLPPLAGPSQVFALASGDALPGYWVGINGNQLEIETAWKGRIKLPAEAIERIGVRGGRVTSLADLEPVAVEEVPYFGRVVPWGRDSGFDGAPPMLDDKRPLRSIAMHARCVLTYALDGEYETFKATLGFDDSAGDLGRVACRVLVDGREAFAAADFRAGEEPQAVEVPLAGAKQMTLEVDFGEGEDVGDRILWAEPRLFRAETASTGRAERTD